MLDVAEIIFQTCKTYLIQQGKFLLMLFVLIALCDVVLLLGLHAQRRRSGERRRRTQRADRSRRWSWCCSSHRRHGRFVLRWPGTASASIPTPTARTAFASLRGEPWDVVNIPLRAGMSIGLFLISLELVMMVIILLFVPRQIVGFCFLGFAIGESLGASALAHRRRYFHEDRRHRLRPDEDRLQRQGRRSAQSRRDRRLHGRQRRRLGRPDGRRLRNLRRDGRGPDLVHHAGHPADARSTCRPS